MGAHEVISYNAVCDACGTELALLRATPQEALAQAEFLTWEIDGSLSYCENCRADG